MNERNRPAREITPGFAGFNDPLDEPDDGDRLVTVTSGPYAEQLPVSNSTVGEIRTRLRDRFDIDRRSTAVLDGNDVADDTVVRAGQVLMFVHRAGEKGANLRNP